MSQSIIERDHWVQDSVEARPNTPATSKSESSQKSEPSSDDEDRVPIAELADQKLADECRRVLRKIISALFYTHYIVAD